MFVEYVSQIHWQLLTPSTLHSSLSLLQGLAHPNIAQKLREYAAMPGGYFFGGGKKKNDKRSELMKFTQGSIMCKLQEGLGSTIQSVTQKLEVDELWEENDNKDANLNAKEVERTISFIEAHLKAQRTFKHDFCSQSQILSCAEQKVLAESQKQVEAAQAMLRSKDPTVLHAVISLQLSTVLLNGAALLIEGFVEKRLLTEREGEECMKREKIEEELLEVLESIQEECSKKARKPPPSNAEMDTGVAVEVGKGSTDESA